MAKAYKVCKVCGKEYEYCLTKADGQFRWMDVACCPEHAVEYFTQVAISRGEAVEEPDKANKKKARAIEPDKTEPAKDFMAKPE